MNRIKQTIIALAIGLSLANCGDDFLDTTSSDQMSDSNTFTTIDGAGTVPLPRTILFGINVGF